MKRAFIITSVFLGLLFLHAHAVQTEPFIHVDGDVYLPQPLPKEIENAPLVAQNREIGTQYYRKMLDNGLLCYSNVHIPENIKEEIAMYVSNIFN